MTEETEQQSQEPGFAPGALLKRTREQKGLSLEEVSTRLKLTLPVLNKIENDDYEGDLPVTFYRGYLKNYAELLELEDVDICANFQQFCKENNLFSTPPPRLQGLELDKPVNSNNWLFKVVTGLIILALIVAIYYMVVEKELWKKLVPDSAESETVSSEADESGLSLDGSLDDGSDSSDEQDNTLMINSSDSDAEDSRANSSEDSLMDDDTGGIAIPQSGDSQSGDLSVEGETENASVDGSSSSDKAQVESQQVSSGGQLLLTFDDDCWVRIEDASGKVLALGIKSGGTSLQLSGQAPYSLTLGKASAVQLSYDGQAVDLSQYPDTRAAKLTVGGS
jgi:cytoskeleton protein RodZ